jgi:Cysteine-rich secretory protein family
MVSLIVLIATLVAAPDRRGESAATGAVPASMPCPPGGEWQLADMVNAFRVRHGAWELPLSAELTAKAQAWSDTMATTGQLAHSSLDDGVSPGWTAITENVTLDASVAAAEVFFEQSPVHRANLLGAMTEMGLGVSRDGHGRVWVAQVFAQRSVSTPPYRGPANSSAYHPTVPFVTYESPGVLPVATTTVIDVAGTGGIPLAATAVMATFDVTGATDRGVLQVVLPDSPVAATTTMALDVGDTATSAIVPLDDEGRLLVHTSIAARVRVTISGSFVPSGGPIAAGRFTPVDPVSVVSGPLAHGSASVAVTGLAAVPATGVSAVALQVRTSADDIVDIGGVPAAGLALVPVGPNGTVEVLGPSVGEVSISIVGWFTDATAPAAVSGLFVSASPARLLDTRSSDAAVAGGRRVYVPGRHDLPACPRAVVTTLTVYPEDSSTAAQVGPFHGVAQGAMPTLVADEAWVGVSATTVSATGVGYDLGVHLSTPAQLTVDIAGWFV